MKINLQLKKLSKWLIIQLNPIIIFASILIIVIFGFFLYFNFYQTIISAKEIIILQADVTPGKINITLLDKIETSYQNKLEPQEYDWSQFSRYFSSNFSTSGSSDNSPDAGFSPQSSF